MRTDSIISSRPPLLMAGDKLIARCNELADEMDVLRAEEKADEEAKQAGEAIGTFILKRKTRMDAQARRCRSLRFSLPRLDWSS